MQRVLFNIRMLKFIEIINLSIIYKLEKDEKDI
jgi:hypothetical protein